MFLSRLFRSESDPPRLSAPAPLTPSLEEESISPPAVPRDTREKFVGGILRLATTKGVPRAPADTETFAKSLVALFKATEQAMRNQHNDVFHVSNRMAIEVCTAAFLSSNREMLENLLVYAATSAYDRDVKKTEESLGRIRTLFEYFPLLTENLMESVQPIFLEPQEVASGEQ